jgi:hypothetical protein
LGNFCTFHATAISVFIFKIFLNEVIVVPPPVRHVSVCLLSIKYAHKIHTAHFLSTVR